MSQRENNDVILHCSFCRKTEDEVVRLIAGNGVYICDECIELCHEIISDGFPYKEKKSKGYLFVKCFLTVRLS